MRIDGLALKKGDVVTPERRRMLAEAGVASVVAARLEEGDVGENEAAAAPRDSPGGQERALARAPFTGRVNLFAEAAGLALFDRGAIDRVNAVDEAITVATLPSHRVGRGRRHGRDGQDHSVRDTRANAGSGARSARARRAVSVAPFRPLRVAVVSTLLPGLKESVIEKTLRALEGAPRPDRRAGRRARHEPARNRRAARGASAPRAAADVLVVFGASAITDRRDVIPAAIEAFGGRIERFGMPVDPGNLLLLASRGEKPIIGAPGCARSPEGERLRLGPAAHARRRGDHRPRHPRDGRRRALDGDRVAASAPRAA